VRIVLAPNAFKGSLSAMEVAQAMFKGATQVLPQATLTCLPIADGGDGFVETMVAASEGTIRHSTVRGPLGRQVSAAWGVLGTKQAAVIEMAAASGLNLVPKDQRNPCQTSTYGTGELMRAALDAGYRELIIGIGGSATNDGGAGMAEALGVRFLDKFGRSLPPGGLALRDLSQIDLTGLDPRLADCHITAACDVDNPLLGPTGASAVYGPQKGATLEMVAALDEALSNYAAVIAKTTGRDVAKFPGAGAAGGLGAGLMALLGAKLTPGFLVVADALQLAQAIARSDLVFTGEGQVDGQTMRGKAVHGVVTLAAKYQRPVIVLGGLISPSAKDLLPLGMTAAISIANGPMSLKECMENAATLLEEATANALRMILVNFSC